MRRNKFKVGDKVIVVGDCDNPHHFVQINAVGKVLEPSRLLSDDYRVEFLQKYNVNNQDPNYCSYFYQTINKNDLRHHDDYILGKKLECLREKH